jgi:toxin ParE1/3/4
LPLSYFFHPEARSEHLDQVAFYEERMHGLGARYLDSFDHTIERICSFPERYPMTTAPNVRRLSFNEFPFSVLYRSTPNAVQILAVAAHRRRPGYWLKRQ